jgi:hypothetical protein
MNRDTIFGEMGEPKIYTNIRNTKFKYLDEVRIKSGFYEGFHGIIAEVATHLLAKPTYLICKNNKLNEMGLGAITVHEDDLEIDIAGQL